jgi:hypothetical protein
VESGGGEEDQEHCDGISLNAEGGGVCLGRRWRQNYERKLVWRRRGREGGGKGREFGEKNGDEGGKKISGTENNQERNVLGWAAATSEATGNRHHYAAYNGVITQYTNSP